MAATLQVGSSGSQVKKLQDMLSKAGYFSGQASGTYDQNTAAAVQKYQQSQGMSGNGVFDNATLQKLYGTLANPQQTPAASPEAPAATKPAAPKAPTPSAAQDTIDRIAQIAKGYTPTEEVTAGLRAGSSYTPGQQVTDAQKKLAAQEGAQPGSYQSQYQPLIDSLFDQITNRKPFQYNINGDALYNLYRDRYTQGGQMAMQDTMGKASALTGGYGNSYAAQVGQQTYNQYMTELADKIPELEQMAYSRYQDEGDRLREQMNMAMQREQQDYDRWGDEYDRWQNERGYAADRADRAAAEDYDRWAADRNYWQQQEQQGYNRWADDRDYWQNQEQTEYGRSKAQIDQDRETAYDMAMTMIKSGALPTDDALTRAGINPADAKAMVDLIKSQAAAAAAGTSGGGGRGGSAKGDTKKVTDEMIEKASTLYANGGMDNVAGYLDQLEYQGYDAEYLFDYLQKYVRMSANTGEGLKIASGNQNRADNLRQKN